MADEATAASEQTQVTFSIKSSSDSKYNVTVPTTTTIADLKTKLSTAEYANIPAERMRLIYSGRVLKDHDTVASVKIKDSHTVHLVKSAESNARQNPANQGSSVNTSSNSSGGQQPSAAAQIPSNFATGVGNDPLAHLTGARYAGFHGLPGADTFGPDGGLTPQDPDQILRMMDNPNFMQQMNEAMDNPAFIQMMQNNPMMRDNPAAQAIFRDPALRRQLLSPEMLRAQVQLQRAMGGAGGPGGSFPAPGVTNTTTGQGNQTTESGNNASGNTPATGNSNPGSPPPNPFASLLGGAGGNASNPFAALFGPGAEGFGSPPAQGGEGQQGGQYDLGQLAQQMQQMQQLFGGDNGGGLFGGQQQTPQAPPDNRPPEERYADQLRQLNDMGFYDFDRNITALRRSGGSVPGAVDFLLNG